MARIQTARRRRKPYELGDLTIDFAHRQVTVAGREVQLTATEYDLLAELAVNAGRVVRHEELLQRVWGPTNPGSPKAIRTHLMPLRQRLGEDGENPAYIFAEPRVGHWMAVGEGITPEHERPQVESNDGREVPPYRQCNAAGIPSRLHTVYAPVTDPSSARPKVPVRCLGFIGTTTVPVCRGGQSCPGAFHRKVCYSAPPDLLFGSPSCFVLTLADGLGRHAPGPYFMD